MAQQDVVAEVLKVNGFGSLNPAQQLAVDSGLLEEGNFVFSAPTASGKTVIAEIAMLDMLKKGKKVVYIVPLKALGSEKYQEFRKKYEPLGIRIALSIGDMDANDSWLSGFDVIIATSEKLDSLLRHGMEWIRSIGLVIADEIHLLDDVERGPTLEIVLARLRAEARPKILGLSATISNYQELAAWLEAKCAESDYRPVKLEKGICFDKKLSFPDREVELQSDTYLPEILDETVSKGKQALVFLSTKRGAESTAEKMGGMISGKVKKSEELAGLSRHVLQVLENPTGQCKRLSACIANGVAFHHSGLAPRQREAVEDGFRKGQIRVICATPTLAAGINLPAWRVVVRDLKRFHSFTGMGFLSNLEVQQMAGRAGRPQYDTEGQAILMPKTSAEAMYAWESYINGKPEEIRSKLGSEPILKMHTLSLISSGITRSRKEIFEFYSRTFYAHHYGDMRLLQEKIGKILEQLAGYGFISMDGQRDAIEDNPFRSARSMRERKSFPEQSADYPVEATKIGKRISELYINPDTAHALLSKLEKAAACDSCQDLDLIFMMTDALEMKPLSGIRKPDFSYLNDFLIRDGESLMFKPPSEWDAEYENYLRVAKTALMFRSWISEKGEDSILEDFGITPGELKVKLDIGDWLLYSMSELALLNGHQGLMTPIKRLRIRLTYGIREELLPLVKLKGVGRVRARRLFDSNIRSLQDLRKAPMESLERIVGAKTAMTIKEQLGESSNLKETLDL